MTGVSLSRGWEFKVCRDCGETKDVSLFHRDRAKSDGRRSYCMKCVEKRNAGRYSRETNIKDRYALTLEEVEDMLSKQGGKCALCSIEFTGNEYKIDHCHTTRRVRGLLCSRCNTCLGGYEYIMSLGTIEGYLT